MYKTSLVVAVLLHLFILFHLPQPIPTAAMSVNERTYIMVKVGTRAHYRPCMPDRC